MAAPLRRALLLAAVLLAAGCASRLAEREAYLAQFVGVSETDLVRQLGVPDRTVETGGTRFLAYVEKRTEIVRPPPMFVPWFGGPRLVAPIRPSEIVEHVCETTFEVTGGKVTAYRLRGDACG